MPPFKDEHVLIIAPGSQTTLAQLGLPESYTPARLRVKTRMFPAPTTGEWEPVKIREKQVKKAAAPPPPVSGTENEANGTAMVEDEEQEEETQYEEDLTSDEGAVWPLQQGRIVDWGCFFALISHVHETLSPPFHTPILLIAQPSWTQQDHEAITQFIFEKFKTPAFALMDHALATAYAYSTGTATVIDIGYDKCDVTAINDFLISDIGRGAAVPDCGGAHMTRRLQKLLTTRGFTEDMSEQLKRSNICEVLPPNVALPTEKVEPANPAAAASTGVNGTAGQQTKTGGAVNGLPRGPGVGTDVGGDEVDDKDAEDNEGILDVASIVTSGKTNEFLAKKEKEKAERAALRKEKREAEAAAKPMRLPNSQRPKNTFYYTEQPPPGAQDPVVEPESTTTEQPPAPLAQPPPETPIEAPKPQDSQPAEPAPADGTASVPQSAVEPAEGSTLPKKEERRKPRDSLGNQRKEIEVGTERFRAADDGMLERIADSIHRCILSVPEIAKRSELWDSLIIVGNGSKIRGFKDALFATITNKYLISPSSATIFTSELPSNMTTPAGTGANTPQPQPQPSHHGSGVNPLLLAATTASNTALSMPGQPPAYAAAAAAAAQGHGHVTVHSSHGQTPTSIKLAKMAEYFPEWKEVGFEEAHFLGAQVAAKIVFIIDQGLSKGFMSRSEYNDLGPQGIHEFSL